MLKLKGQTGSGEWVVFSVSDIEDADRDYTEIRLLNVDNINYILTSTIQPSDDPRKAMLKEILAKLKTLRWWSHFEDFKDLALVSLADVEDILHEHEITVTLDEMEAKL